MKRMENSNIYRSHGKHQISKAHPPPSPLRVTEEYPSETPPHPPPGRLPEKVTESAYICRLNVKGGGPFPCLKWAKVGYIITGLRKYFLW